MPRTILNPHLRRVFQSVLLCTAVFSFCAVSEPSSHFNDLGHQLMCICGCGQILLECNHVGCTSSDGMRNALREALKRGDSDSLVQEAFVQKYGPTVLAAPSKTGFDRTAWIIPFVLLILGFTLVIHVVQVWKNCSTQYVANGLRPIHGARLDAYREQVRKETEP